MKQAPVEILLHSRLSQLCVKMECTSLCHTICLWSIFPTCRSSFAMLFRCILTPSPPRPSTAQPLTLLLWLLHLTCQELPSLVFREFVFSICIRLNLCHTCTICVSVHSSCYNKTPKTKWLINNKFVTGLEVASPRSQWSVRAHF